MALSLAAEEPLSIRVQEQSQGFSALLTVTLEGKALQAIALFSEPSHTLLGLINDNRRTAKLDDLESFTRKIKPSLNSRTARMSLPLVPKASARLQTQARPQQDSQITILYIGGAEEEPQSFTVAVSPNFDVTVTMPTGAAATYSISCGGDDSCSASTTCTPKNGNTTGTCCKTSTIDCPSCGKSKAYCGLRLCEICVS